MDTQRWDTLFVGAGITSLACAALMMKRDPSLRLLLIDKHIVPGGYASTFSRPRVEATFDCSLHKLSGMDEEGNLLRILRELGLEDALGLVRPKEYFQACCDGQTLVLPNDVDGVRTLLTARFPHEAAGIATFGSVAAAEAFGARLHGDNHILVAEQDGRVVGVIELKEGRHLAMLFVDPGYQGQGIGHALFDAVLPQVREPVLTVRASLNAVPTYLRYGFVLDGDVGEFNGLVYQQMVRAAA